MLVRMECVGIVVVVDVVAVVATVVEDIEVGFVVAVVEIAASFGIAAAWIDADGLSFWCEFFQR